MEPARETDRDNKDSSAAADADRSDADVIASSAMHDRYGGLAKTVFAWLFGTISYPEGKATAVHSLAERGVVVYVARAPSMGLALYFNHLLSRIGLPLPRFVGGINLWLWQPIGRLLKARSKNRDDTQAWQARMGGKTKSRERALASTVFAREPAFLFLPRKRTRTRAGEKQNYDYVRSLVVAQRLSKTPIFLVPHAVTDQVVASGMRRTLRDRLLGERRRQGRLRQLAMLISPTRHATVRVAEEIDLEAFVAEHAELNDEVIARRLRHELNRRISEEERIIAGPELPNYDAITRHVERNANLRQAVEQASAAGQSLRSLEKKVRFDLRSIAARYSATVVRISDRTLHWVFNRIYDGIVVDEPGLANVIDTARKGPIVFCPTHRSHVDYLVLSYVLFRHGITPPHIAAGANLSFFPLGTYFRRCGAFFLRRTFRDDAVYAAVFKAYVAELLRHGTSIEFFPEGTRSRTGKMLLPRFGMFNMIVDAWRQEARDDVLFVPVSIDYERIIEAKSYEKELAGAEKKAEDVRGLLKTTSVLRSRYGRVHLQFGQPISLSELAAQHDLPQSAEHDHDKAARRVVDRLGHWVVHDIARLSSVLPTSIVSTALLSYRGRGMSQHRLLESCERLLRFLDDHAARMSESLQLPEGREQALLEAVENLVDEGMVEVDRAGKSDAEAIFHVPDEKRILLDYYKNALLNHFAPAALVARSLVRHGAHGVAEDAVREDVKFLSRLFKREFLFRADSGFDVHFEDVVASMSLSGLIDYDIETRTLTAPNDSMAQLIAGLIDPFVEAYWMASKTALRLTEFPLWHKELANRALESTRRAFLEGDIRRPESANQNLIGNAIAWLRNEGFVEASEPGSKKSTLRVIDEAELAAIAHKTSEFAIIELRSA